MIEVLYLYIIANVGYFLYFNLHWSNHFTIMETECGYKRLKKIEELWIGYRTFTKFELVVGIILIPSLMIILIQKGLEISGTIRI